MLTSAQAHCPLIPAKAGIQCLSALGPRFRQDEQKSCYANANSANASL